MPDTPHRAALRTGSLHHAFLSVGSEIVECAQLMASTTRTLRSLLPFDPALADGMRAVEERCETIRDHAHVLIYGSREGQSILMARLASARLDATIPAADTPTFAWAWTQPLDLVILTIANQFRPVATQMQQILHHIDTTWLPQASAPWCDLWQEGRKPLEPLTLRLLEVIDDEFLGILLPRIRQEQLSSGAILE